MKNRSRLVMVMRSFFFAEKGGAVAELAILVPFLAIMLAGVSEFGRFFQTYNTLAKATRDSARYLSNHPFTTAEQDNAKNLLVCGKLVCAGGDELVKGITTANVCIESTGSPKIETVTVSIPRADAGCGSPFLYQPIFNIGALLNSPTFSLALPINASTTMYYMID